MGMNIRYLGFEAWKRRLGQVADRIGPGMEGATRKAVLYVHSQVPPYPEANAGSTYRRTGTLGRTITTEVRGLGAMSVGVIGTPTVYAPHVISDRQVGKRGPQTWFHARWWTLQGVARKAYGQVLKFYNEALREILFK